MEPPESTLIPVHVALPNPSLGAPAWRPRTPRDSETFADSRVDWDKHGLEPRWLGDESSDCAAALDPSIFFDHGGDELNRFLAGARHRGETAVVIATLGRADDEATRSPLSTHDASVHLTPGFETRVAGRRSPAATKPKLATEVTGPERDLGLRLLTRPDDAPWWEMELTGNTWLPGAGGPPITHQPTGTLAPILVDALGAPVLAVWVSPDAGQRVYVMLVSSDRPLEFLRLLAQLQCRRARLGMDQRTQFSLAAVPADQRRRKPSQPQHPPSRDPTAEIRQQR